MIRHVTFGYLIHDELLFSIITSRKVGQFVLKFLSLQNKKIRRTFRGDGPHVLPETVTVLYFLLFLFYNALSNKDSQSKEINAKSSNLVSIVTESLKSPMTSKGHHWFAIIICRICSAWRRQEFSLGEGAIDHGSRNRSPLFGSKGKAPVWSLIDEVTQKLKQFADIFFTDFDCRNDQNLKISHISPADS